MSPPWLSTYIVTSSRNIRCKPDLFTFLSNLYLVSLLWSLLSKISSTFPFSLFPRLQFFHVTKRNFQFFPELHLIQNRNSHFLCFSEFFCCSALGVIIRRLQLLSFAFISRNLFYMAICTTPVFMEEMEREKKQSQIKEHIRRY